MSKVTVMVIQHCQVNPLIINILNIHDGWIEKINV